jgi:hypothetical protein
MIVGLVSLVIFVVLDSRYHEEGYGSRYRQKYTGIFPTHPPGQKQLL